eukprot:Awhi_evm1s5757
MKLGTEEEEGARLLRQQKDGEEERAKQLKSDPEKLHGSQEEGHLSVVVNIEEETEDSVRDIKSRRLSSTLDPVGGLKSSPNSNRSLGDKSPASRRLSDALVSSLESFEELHQLKSASSKKEGSPGVPVVVEPEPTAKSAAKPAAKSAGDPVGNIHPLHGRRSQNRSRAAKMELRKSLDAKAPSSSPSPSPTPSPPSSPPPE